MYEGYGQEFIHSDFWSIYIWTCGFTSELMTSLQQMHIVYSLKEGFKGDNDVDIE